MPPADFVLVLDGGEEPVCHHFALAGVWLLYDFVQSGEKGNKCAVFLPTTALCSTSRRHLHVTRSASRGIRVTCILTQAVNIHGHSLDFELFPSHIVNVQHSQRPILPWFLRCTQGAMHLKTRSYHVNDDLYGF